MGRRGGAVGDAAIKIDRLSGPTKAIESAGNDNVLSVLQSEVIADGQEIILDGFVAHGQDYIGLISKVNAGLWDREGLAIQAQSIGAAYGEGASSVGEVIKDRADGTAGGKIDGSGRRIGGAEQSRVVLARNTTSAAAAPVQGVEPVLAVAAPVVSQVNMVAETAGRKEAEPTTPVRAKASVFFVERFIVIFSRPKWAIGCRSDTDSQSTKTMGADVKTQSIRTYLFALISGSRITE